MQIPRAFAGLGNQRPQSLWSPVANSAALETTALPHIASVCSTVQNAHLQGSLGAEAVEHFPDMHRILRSNHSPEVGGGVPMFVCRWGVVHMHVCAYMHVVVRYFRSCPPCFLRQGFLLGPGTC